MPARSPRASTPARDRIIRLGEAIRQARKRQGVTAVAAAEAAGLSRPTWHRIERGEGSVAMSAWAAAAEAVRLTFEVTDPNMPPAPRTLPASIRLESFSELKKLAWQLDGVETLGPREAFDLYERNWRHVDTRLLGAEEAALIDALSATFGAGRLLV